MVADPSQARYHRVVLMIKPSTTLHKNPQFVTRVIDAEVMLLPTYRTSEDINCIFPIDRFRELEAEGVIGGLAEISYSFMGLIPDPASLINDTAPDAARRLKDAGVDAAFLAST